MHGPAVLSWLLAALTAATGGLCLVRLRRAPAGGHGAGRESDAAEAVMGLGMAVVIVGGDRLPPPLWAGAFGLLAAGFLLAAAGGAAGRRAHRLHHAVGALAMVYMALAMSAGGAREHPAMAGMAAPMGLPALTGLLLLYYGGYALWTGSRLLTTTGHHAAAGSSGLPRACRLAMGVGMFAMLLAL